MARRYKKYHFFLDLFGLVGLVSAVFYYYYGHATALKHQELYNLWGNLATDMLGIWVSVRIIDFIIRRQEQQQATRINVVKNMRFLRNEVRRTIEFSGNLELDSLKEELRWAKGILDRRKPFFRRDEISDLNVYYDALSNLIPGLEELVKVKEAHSAGQKTREELAVEVGKCRSCIPNIEELRLKAERNILEESEEE